MKKLYLTFILFISCLSFSQESAGIYYISFRVDDELRNELEATHKERKFFSSYSEQAHFPEELINEMKDSIQASVSKVLNVNAECVYALNRKGDTIYTLGMNGELEGMPVQTKGKAIKTHNKTHYVRVDVSIVSSGGVAVELPNGTRSRLKPMITYTITSFNGDGKRTFKEKVKLKDFGVLKSIERDSGNGNWRVKESDVLHPEDIYQMFLLAMRSFNGEYAPN